MQNRETRTEAKFGGLLHPLVVLICTIWIVACAPGSLDRSLITHEPCSPPCWCRITPGAAYEDAVQALRACPWVRADSINETSTATNTGAPLLVIGWDHSSRLLGPAVTRNPNVAHVCSGTVRLITVYLDYSLELDEVVEKYGVPQGVYATRGDGNALLAVALAAFVGIVVGSLPCGEGLALSCVVSGVLGLVNGGECPWTT